MNSSVYRCSGVEETVDVHIDAHSSSIQDLEEKLGQYHSCDRIPAWAKSLIRRVELLENVTSEDHSDPRTAILPPRSAAMIIPSTVQEKATILITC